MWQPGARPPADYRVGVPSRERARSRGAQHPGRTLPASVYWRRRLVVLTAALLVFVGLGKALSHSTGSDAALHPAAALPSPTLTVTPAPTKKPRVKKHPATAPTFVAPPTPTLVAPTGVCADGDVLATPSVPSAVAGQDVTIVLELRTATNPACTWRLAPSSLAVKITSGSDFIWSSQECPAAIAPQSVVVRQAVATQVTLRWNAKRSDATCSAYTDWALPGYYHVAAAALGGNRSDAQFKLLAPSPTTVYVTKTAKPKPTSSASPGSPSSPSSSGR